MKRYIRSANNFMDASQKFSDYLQFLYQNSLYTRDQLHQVAIYLWTRGFTKYEALDLVLKYGLDAENY